MKTRFLLFIFLLIYRTPLFSQDLLSPANLDGRWGFIDEYERWIIREKFEEAFPFSEGVAAVQYYGKWGYIDPSGNWLINPTLAGAKPFSEGVACAKAYGKWGFIDKTGAWMIQPQYYAVSSFSEGKAVVLSDEGFFYINTRNEPVFNTPFKKAFPYSEGLAFVTMGGKKGFIDSNGNWLFKADYDEVYAYSEGLAMVIKNDMYGFIDRRGDIRIPLIYKNATQFSEGRAGVLQNSKWGYINKKGEPVIESKFEYAGPFMNGKAVARMNGKYGIINTSGDWLIDPVYQDLQEFTRPISIRQEIENLVVEKIRDWESKDEYEKTSEYLERIKPENREKEIEIQVTQSIQELGKKYIRSGDAELGIYNADMEAYNILVPGALPTMIPVPISDAKWFRKYWNLVRLDLEEFTLYNESFVITRLKATLEDKVYNYDASRDGVYASTLNLSLEPGQTEVFLPEYTVLLSKKEEGPKSFSRKSDIDINIPEGIYKNENLFALVIGNEDYSSYQVNLGGEVNVEFAEADARIFYEYLLKTLGVPSQNITLLINATAGQINQALAKMSYLAKAYKGEAELLFYYAGHGLPDEVTREPYLIPVDVSGTDLTFAVSLENVYARLTEYETKKVTVFLDACFSGGARKESLVAARGIRIRPKSPFVQGNLVVFSATTLDQTAYALKEKNHGLFTYYLLKKIRESKGIVTYGELADYLIENVNKNSLLANNREQIPTIKVSPVFETVWKDFTLIP